MLGKSKKYTTVNTRRYKRLTADYLVKFQQAGQNAEPNVANIKDISAGGLRFWSQDYYAEGTLLRISVWVPPIDRTLETLGRVVRVRKAKNSSCFYLGISFIELNKDSQIALNDFIESVSQSDHDRQLVDHMETVKRSVRP